MRRYLLTCLIVAACATLAACGSDTTTQSQAPEAPVACAAIAQLFCVAVHPTPVPANANIILSYPDGQVTTWTCPGAGSSCNFFVQNAHQVADCNNIMLPLAGGGSYGLVLDADGFVPSATPFAVQTDACGLYTEAPSDLYPALSR